MRGQDLALISHVTAEHSLYIFGILLFRFMSFSMVMAYDMIRKIQWNMDHAKCQFANCQFPLCLNVLGYIEKLKWLLWHSHNMEQKS